MKITVYLTVQHSGEQAKVIFLQIGTIFILSRYLTNLKYPSTEIRYEQHRPLQLQNKKYLVQHEFTHKCSSSLLHTHTFFKSLDPWNSLGPFSSVGGPGRAGLKPQDFINSKHFDIIIITIIISLCLSPTHSHTKTYRFLVPSERSCNPHNTWKRNRFPQKEIVVASC